jgi:hypothetical protein
MAEKPFFDRLVDLNRQMEALREDIKEVCVEAREADIRIMPLKLAVKLYLESDEKRSARLEKEAEADRILRALGPFADSDLGKAAVEEARRPARGPGRRRKNAAPQAVSEAVHHDVDGGWHLNGPSNTPDIIAEREQALVDPYKAGREAALRGFNESRNPFDAGSLVGEEWIEGFRVGETERTGEGSAPAA